MSGAVSKDQLNGIIIRWGQEDGNNSSFLPVQLSMMHDNGYIYIGDSPSNDCIVGMSLLRMKSENTVVLDKCRTLWGEPERVQLSNVHGAVACACVPTWSSCMRMCSYMEQMHVHDCQCMS